MRRIVHSCRKVFSSLLARRTRLAQFQDADIRIAPRATRTPNRVQSCTDGWRVYDDDNTLCHCFAAWYDECRLRTGGHVEVRKHREQMSEVTVFTWCPISRTYSRAEDFVERRHTKRR